MLHTISSKWRRRRSGTGKREDGHGEGLHNTGANSSAINEPATKKQRTSDSDDEELSEASFSVVEKARRSVKNAADAAVGAKGKHKKTLKANARKASDSKVDDEIEEERSNSTNGCGHTEKSISIANEVKGSQTRSQLHNTMRRGEIKSNKVDKENNPDSKSLMKTLGCLEMLRVVVPPKAL